MSTNDLDPKIEAKIALFFQHPAECPEMVGDLPYLIHPPSKFSATERWEFFRDKTVLPMIEHRPHDPNLPNFLKRIEAILTWRATVAPEDRFWRCDA